MVMICQCRKINDDTLTQAFQTLKEISYGGDIQRVSDLEPLLGDYDCGGCSRIFERAVEHFNQTGDIGIFKRAREKEKALVDSGLCSTAVNRDYSATSGIPDLLKSAIAADHELAR